MMITKQQIFILRKQKLLRGPVLSLYLNTDRKNDEGEHYLGQLRRLLKEADEQIAIRYKKAPAMRKKLVDEISPRVLELIDKKVESNKQTHAVVCFADFSRKGKIIFQALPRPVRSQIQLQDGIFIRPLLFLLDQFEDYAILAANQQKGHFILMSLGQAEHIKDFMAEIPHHNDQGGWAQTRYQRRYDQAVQKHVKQITAYAVKYFAKTKMEPRIVLVGSADFPHFFRAYLPQKFQQKIVGKLPSISNENISSLLERTMPIVKKAEEDGEKETVNELKNLLSHEGKATSGVKETLNAINQKRILKLILLKEFKKTGSICTNCGSISEATKQCKNCLSTVSQTDDIIETACERVYEDKAEIEFIEESLELEALGGIGAILRY